MLFNISLPEMNENSDKHNVELIRGYLATLNDQLRFMLLNIDEDNLSDDLLRLIKASSSLTSQWKAGEQINGQSVADGTVSCNKLAKDSMQRTDLSGNPNGLYIGKELELCAENGSARLFINESGSLTVETANGSIPFSLVLTKEDEAYKLNLCDRDGNAICCVPLQNNT